MTPSFLKVVIDGNDVTQVAAFLILMDAQVTHELNRHPVCRVRYRQPPSSRFFYEPMIGKDLVIKAVDNAGAEIELFKGVVRQADAAWDLNDSSVISFHGIGKSCRLDTFNKSQNFVRESLENIVNRLAGDSLGDLIIPEPGPTSCIQYDETNWSFLARICDRFGAFLRVEGDKIDVIDNFQPPVVDLAWRTENGLQSFRTTAKIVPRALFGANFFSGDATSRQFEDVLGDVSAEDSLPNLRAGALDGSAANKLVSAVWNKFLARDHDLFKQELEFESDRQTIHSCTAFGESRVPEVVVGNQIQITDNPDVEGVYGVYRLVHEWAPDAGYVNRFWCTPYTSYMDSVRPRCDRFYGPVIARVAEIGRAESRTAFVKLNFLWEEETTSDWIPIIAPNAGADRGICFIPEVGDQVLVLFQGGDSSKPFIVGSLWNGVDRPPVEDLHGGEYAHNDIKRIVTKSGNRLVFDDKEGKETLVMAGPKHVRVSLFDGGSTLLLHSDGDIHINAGGTVHMKCAKFLREVGS